MSPSTGAEVDRKIAAVLIAAVQAYLEDEDGGRARLRRSRLEDGPQRPVRMVPRLLVAGSWP